MVRVMCTGWESVIFTENGIIEIASCVMLFVCVWRCAQYAWRSSMTSGRSFWLASVLVFLTVIRRELNHVPERIIPPNFELWHRSYAWWEDMILLVIYVIALGLLAYGWRYLWAMLKRVPKSLYVIVAILAIIQYLSENTIGFSAASSMVVEELAEVVIYGIALGYIWRFDLPAFETPHNATLSRPSAS